MSTIYRGASQCGEMYTLAVRFFLPLTAYGAPFCQGLSVKKMAVADNVLLEDDSNDDNEDKVSP